MTESDLHRLIKESVQRILAEHDPAYDIEDFSDDDIYTEQEETWWSPDFGFSSKPNSDGLWFKTTIDVDYSYTEDGQMTEFGWHEDGTTNAISCHVNDILPYMVMNGEIMEYDEDIDNMQYDKYCDEIERTYLKA